MRLLTAPNRNSEVASEKNAGMLLDEVCSELWGDFFRVSGLSQPLPGSEDVTQEDLQPCSNPESALQNSLAVLLLANGAKRKELDWQAQNEVPDWLI